MGGIRKVTFHRTTESKSLGFYAGVILLSALILALLSFMPRNYMVFGWGTLLLVAVVTYPLLSTMPRRKAMALAALASVAGAIAFSCYFAQRRNLVWNVAWVFVAVTSIFVIQVSNCANLSARLDAVVTVVPLVVAAHLGIMWLLVYRDVVMASYILRVTIVMACGALALLAPLAQRTSFFVVTAVTAVGLVAFSYNSRQMKPLAALCIGFTCAVILMAGSRYIGLLTKEQSPEPSEGVLTRKQHSIRVQMAAGFAAIVAMGFMSYFFGAVFIL